MLESEAREKWCPFSRVFIRLSPEKAEKSLMPPPIAAASFNRTYRQPGEPLAAPTLCMGRECMAWKISGDNQKGDCRLMDRGADG